jgi:hypothetical protein
VPVSERLALYALDHWHAVELFTSLCRVALCAFNLLMVPLCGPSHNSVVRACVPSTPPANGLKPQGENSS